MHADVPSFNDVQSAWRPSEAYLLDRRKNHQEPLENTIISLAEKDVPQGNNKGDNGMCKNRNIFEFRPGVIVDMSTHLAYLMNPQGGIDALDLSSGNLVWNSDKAAKPLFLCDKVLIAQARNRGRVNILRIVALNTQDIGNPVFEASFELPNEVSALIDDGLGTSFRVTARTHQDDLILSWMFYRQIITGVAPDKDTTAFDYEAAGAVRVDFKTGHVESLRPDEKPPPLEPRLPGQLERLIGQGGVPTPLCRTDNLLTAIKRGGDSGEPRVTLKRWDAKTGEPLPDIPLFGPGFTFRYFSADCRHVLASKLIGSHNVDEAEYLWSIYFVETGTALAEIKNLMLAAWFFIGRSTLIHESRPRDQFVDGKQVDEPLKLRAIDFRTSRQVWERPFRDTAFRGPYPPQFPGGPEVP
ncbi:MAG: hypothetical protein ACREXS_05940 [Gammaproteobacteria bacterium]